MCECGCISSDGEYRIYSDDRIAIAVGVYYCSDCAGPAGVNIYKAEANDENNDDYNAILELPLLDIKHGVALIPVIEPEFLKKDLIKLIDELAKDTPIEAGEGADVIASDWDNIFYYALAKTYDEYRYRRDRK